MLEWIFENKDWLFSGIAIAIPIALIGWWFSAKNNGKQNQIGSGDSTNIQIGGNSSIKYGRGNDG